MDWLIAAPFSREAEDQWLGEFVPGHRHRFSSVPARYEHDRSRLTTTARDWLDFYRHGSRALAAARAADQRTGIITCFPQIPFILGLRQRLSFGKVPVLAWDFNVGNLPTGVKRRISRFALASIDSFVVHSRAEVSVYSEWFALPEHRLHFVPLQTPIRPITLAEDRDNPFILSMGSARRDYRLLFAVAAELGCRTVIVAAPHAVAGLEVPDNVEIQSGLNIQECHELLQRARLSVIPVANESTASGQVTLIDAMMYGRPTVVTAGPGSVDYANHEAEALLVPPGDCAAMKIAIARLWENEALRSRMGIAARRRVQQEFSDEAVGIVMGELLDRLASQSGVKG